MGALTSNRKLVVGVIVGTGVLLGACGGNGGDSVAVEGNVAIAYVKRPVATLGNPTDSIIFSAGGDLYIREKSSPSAEETNVTRAYTNGRGDVSDPEVSYDGTKILFSMRGPNDPTWNIWEYDITAKTLTRLVANDALANQGDDVDPAYLPDGRVVFASNRQETSRANLGYTYLDEYERERVTALHVLDRTSQEIKQISFNQSHDRNPTVLQTGEIMYSRWDHVGGRNQFSIFFANPDGTNLFVLYGAHSPGNSYLHPREMPDGRVVSSLMPLSGTREGGALMVIDIKDYSENNEPAPGVAPGGQGQHQPTAQQINFGRGVSRFGRYSTPYPLWDGTGRMLVTWTPSQPITVTNPLTGQPEEEEGTPVYGVYMFDMGAKTLRPIVLAPAGYGVLDPVALQPRPVPNIIPDKPGDAGLAARGMGILNVKSVYDTDGRQRMGAAVLVAGESIPMAGNVADIAALKDPSQTAAAQRPARFVRITKAVPTPAGISREAIGETEFEMQQILGYSEIEPDGSFKVEVPANTPVGISVVDASGRAFTPHTNWIQVRPGETRTCNGCHSPRRGSALNAPPIAGSHPNTMAAYAAQSGESMAETRTRVDPSMQLLRSDMSYTDVWTDPMQAGRSADTPLSITYAGLTTPAPATGANGEIIINYPEHIQPLWDKACVSCHAGSSAAGGIDLSNVVSGFGRLVSYEELMVGDPILDANGFPVIVIDDDELVVQREEPQVQAASARDSHLIEVLYNQELRSDRALGATDHSGFLNASEKRVASEWADLGGQYYNSPFDGAGNLRGVTGLSENNFVNTVHPILMARCASCHQPFGGNGDPNNPPNPSFQGNRFVLTGNAAGDFNVTVSMVNQITDPATTYLLARPTSDGIAPNPPHPQQPGVTPATPILASCDADYAVIANWIRAGTCP